MPIVQAQIAVARTEVETIEERDGRYYRVTRDADTDRPLYYSEAYDDLDQLLADAEQRTEELVEAADRLRSG